MGGLILEGIITIIFLIISAVLLSGHGAFLISGYNTSTKKEKAKYDEKKLCRATGVLTLIITVLLVVMTVLSYLVETGKIAENDLIPFIIIFAAVIIIAVGFMLYYTNTQCFKK